MSEVVRSIAAPRACGWGGAGQFGRRPGRPIRAAAGRAVLVLGIAEAEAGGCVAVMEAGSWRLEGVLAG